MSEISDLEISTIPAPPHDQTDEGTEEEGSQPESDFHSESETEIVDQISTTLEEVEEEMDLENSEEGERVESPVNFSLQEKPQLIYYLTSHDLYIYDFNFLLKVPDLNPTNSSILHSVALYRILYSTVMPDQRVFFNNASLHWAHERYCFSIWSPELSSLILGNQLGFVSIVHLRRDRSEEEELGKVCVKTMTLTIPMGDSEVMPLAGIDLKRVDPKNPHYFHLFLLHLDGTMRIYLIRRIKDSKLKSQIECQSIPD